MQLNYNVNFASLYEREGLVALDGIFLSELEKTDEALALRLQAARKSPQGLSDKDHSALLIELAPLVEDFAAQLFGVTAELNDLRAKHEQYSPLYAAKRLFVQRRAAKKYKPDEVKTWDAEALQNEVTALLDEDWDELAFASYVVPKLDDAAAHETELEILQRYAAWALHSEAGSQAHEEGILFKLPKKLSPEALIELKQVIAGDMECLHAPDEGLRYREGFALTDDGGTLAEALDEANYCIYCHHQERDSCSKGMRDKEGQFKVNEHRITLAGCPLEEKISEMNELKAAGVPIGALAMVCVDNPMCAGTGHRICNDCMKSCIYQKQEPVNIPKAETRTLNDVLALPYGFEIYSLLTRWNPLNLERPYPKEATHKRVLVAGLGPAGYTLSHHLLNDGHTVVAVDGLKIEPLNPEISGVRQDGSRVEFSPIKDIAKISEKLDERVLAGFGGVAEYGITVRWNKNYLTVLRLLLERRAAFAMHGGVRFGSNLDYNDAFALGFDHIALCLGAGKPTVLTVPNGLAKGVRTASDFLMSLQLTGAAKKNSIANLKLRLPVVVIGGGLTAVDTATEALAYYPLQVEKFLSRYETLVKERGREAVESRWSAEDREIAEEFMAHAKAFRVEKDSAKKEGRDPDILSLIDRFGGVKIVYRKRLIDAPSYRLNHEEVEKAFEEGLYFAELWEPQRFDVDAFGHVASVTLQQAGVEHTKKLDAKTVLVAAGTSPNTVLAREDAKNFTLHGKYFTLVDEDGQHVEPEWVSKPSAPHVLMNIDEQGRGVSFFGDLHPSYAGNVVKAMGSAKQGYPVVSRLLEKRAAEHQKTGFLSDIAMQLTATVEQVVRLTPTIIEIVVKAPLAVRKFEPGQFYRLQNYEANAMRTDDTVLAMEGVALTGAWVDKEKGLISLITLEMGGSSDLCTTLEAGEKVVLMGPTGTPTDIPAGETVLLCGGGLGNAVLFSIGRALRAAGCKVLYFAAYKKAEDRYKMEEIEAAADTVVWCCDERELAAEREGDVSYHGNIVQALEAYGKGELGEMPISLSEVDHIIAIGSDRMMEAVHRARSTVLKPYLNVNHRGIGSINSPMQCMMKEICAQCLQRHIDPVTGEETYVYSCFNQDQSLDSVDFSHLSARLTQNSLQEKLTAMWIDRCLKSLKKRGEAA